ncbi:MAG: ATP phosphoribosyltransferase regulatory subunit, partial [candidate division NC10 bacterium]|nr:ATP phosphoribosyltransferase regulatory subunit [candidate division NC10 bacterium]
MMPRTAIPKGVRVFTPEETAQLRAIQAKLVSVFQRWGFREIITPTFEYLEVFEQPTGEDADDQVFKFVDRQTGRLLALRVDITPQVARLVATTLRHAPLPLRLAYAASVFRYHEPRAGRQREFEQIGVELIGLDPPEADAEMIAMAVEGCQAVGLRAFQIDVGQVEVVRGLLNALQPAPALRPR